MVVVVVVVMGCCTGMRVVDRLCFDYSGSTNSWPPNSSSEALPARAIGV
jgi:hypothetical protein